MREGSERGKEREKREKMRKKERQSARRREKRKRKIARVRTNTHVEAFTKSQCVSVTSIYFNYDHSGTKLRARACTLSHTEREQLSTRSWLLRNKTAHTYTHTLTH